MHPPKRTALVTGATRGIGYEICRQLGQQGWRVFIGSRNLAQGTAAASGLQEEGLAAEAIELDVASEHSIQKAAQELGNQTERLDALVNNAGILLDHDKEGMDFSRESILLSFETNALGPLLLSRALLPLLERGNAAQIVNMSSGMGQLSTMRDGNVAYRISKAALNAITLILSAELSDRRIAVNSMCPGWVRTSMGGEKAPLTPAEGADTAVWLATGGAGNSSGGFYRKRALIPW